MTDWKTILENAGLPVQTAEEIDGQVMASFARGLTPAEWMTFLDLTNKAEARKIGARVEAAMATELKSVTPAQAVAWIDTNVTNLATAKTALKILTRMVIALRDAVMPELPDS